MFSSVIRHSFILLISFFIQMFALRMFATWFCAELMSKVNTESRQRWLKTITIFKWFICILSGNGNLFVNSRPMRAYVFLLYERADKLLKIYKRMRKYVCRSNRDLPRCWLDVKNGEWRNFNKIMTTWVFEKFWSCLRK